MNWLKRILNERLKIALLLNFNALLEFLTYLKFEESVNKKYTGNCYLK